MTQQELFEAFFYWLQDKHIELQENRTGYCWNTDWHEVGDQQRSELIAEFLSQQNPCREVL